MLEKGKISPRQTAELMFITILATAILFVPAIVAEKAGPDAWLGMLSGAIPGIVTLCLLFWLGKKHPGKTLFEYAETILSKWPGKIVGFIYVWVFIQLAATSVREFGDFMSTAFMPNTPLTAFNFSLLFLTALAVIAGLEVIARMNEFIILLVLISLTSITLLAMPNWNLNYLLPFMVSGPLPIMQASAVPAVFTGEIVLLAIIMPFMTRPSKAFVSGVFAVLGATFILTSSVVGALAVFGPELVASFRFPLHLFVRTISIGQLLTRFEVVIMVTWVAGLFIKVSVFYYCIAIGLAQVFGLREYRSLVFPIGIIIAVFSILFFRNVVELAGFIGEVAPLYFVPFFYIGLPGLLLFITLIREKVFGTDFGPKQEQ